MYCKNCGKEIAENGTFCSFCGTKVDAPIATQTTNQDTSVQATGKTDEVNAKNKYPTKTVVLSLTLTFVILFFVFVGMWGSSDSGSNLGSGLTEDMYIQAAENIVASGLKSPSTAIFSNERVAEQDEYGRTIVLLDVEAQNSFGGYIKSSWFILLKSYDPSDGSFNYNPATGVMSIEGEFDFLDESYLKKLKENNHWGEPLE